MGRAKGPQERVRVCTPSRALTPFTPYPRTDRTPSRGTTARRRCASVEGRRLPTQCKPRLTAEQRELRETSLRILARMIAHALLAQASREREHVTVPEGASSTTPEEEE